MTILAVKPLQAMGKDVWFDHDRMHVLLVDGRQISVPLEWFPTLRNASVKQRKKWRFIGRGIGIHWPDLDEDISISLLLGGEC